MRASAGAVDVAIANTGGVRAALPAGPLTYGRLFRSDAVRQSRGATDADRRGAHRRSCATNLEHRGDMIALSGARATATCGVDGLHVSLRRESGKPIGDRELLNDCDQRLSRDRRERFLQTGDAVSQSRSDVDGPIVRDEIAAVADTFRVERGTPAICSGPRIVDWCIAGTRPVQCEGAQ